MQREAVSIRVMEIDPTITGINNYVIAMVIVFFINLVQVVLLG